MEPGTEPKPGTETGIVTHNHTIGTPLTPTELLVKNASEFTISKQAQIELEEAQTDLVAYMGKKIRLKEVGDEAMAVRVRLVSILEQIEAERVAAKAPILEAGRILDGRANVHKLVASGGLQAIDAALKEWDQFQRDEAQRQQDLLREEQEKEQRRLNKAAEKKGEEPKQAKPIPLQAEPAKSTTVVVGGKSVTQVWVDNWKGKLKDIPDTVPINHDQAEAGKYNIPGRFFDLNRTRLNEEVRRMKCTDPFPGSIVIGYNDRYLKKS